MRPLSFTYEVFNRAAGYALNNVIQGFTVLTEEKSRNVINDLELFSDVLWDVASETELEEIIAREFDAPDELDKTIQSTTRAEQGYHRKRLLRGRRVAECALCRGAFPSDMLVAAHIKKRAHCSREECLDDAVVMLACKAGCDALFEEGYIVVEGGVAREARPPTTQDTSDLVARIEGKVCAVWNEASAPYFRWHSHLFKGAT